MFWLTQTKNKDWRQRMKYDEFAFINQQLAGMLRAGIPLEGALRQLCATMGRGGLRTELELLEADLAKGTPLNQALAARKLPDLYVRLLQVGVESNNLPGTLVMVADYYQQVHSLWTRLKAILIYPLIVLLAACTLSIFLVWVYHGLGFGYLMQGSGIHFDPPAYIRNPFSRYLGLLLPPIVLLSLFLGAALVVLLPFLRGRLVWLIPGFKDAALSRFASSLNLMLKSGCSLKTALGLLRKMEANSPLGKELGRWENSVAQGQVKFSELAGGGSRIPPLFVWLVAADGDDWEPGLGRASEIYYSRAVYRAELILNSALPVSTIFMGALIVAQIVAMVHLLTGGALNTISLIGS